LTAVWGRKRRQRVTSLRLRGSLGIMWYAKVCCRAQWANYRWWWLWVRPWH